MVMAFHLPIFSLQIFPHVLIQPLMHWFLLQCQAAVAKLFGVKSEFNNLTSTGAYRITEVCLILVHVHVLHLNTNSLIPALQDDHHKDVWFVPSKQNFLFIIYVAEFKMMVCYRPFSNPIIYVTGPAKIDHVSAKKSLIFSVFAVS